jgi:hypothetical protein
VLGLELCEGKGELVYWYESLSNKRGYSTKVKDLSVKKYKQILWDKIEDMLEIAGYDIAATEQELISNYKDDHMANPPSMAWLSNANFQRTFYSI